MRAAVGGANPDNIAADAAGVGSYLYKPGAALADIEARAEVVVAAYDKVAKPAPSLR